MNFNEWFEKIGMAVITGAAIYASNQMQKMSDSIADLNKIMAGIVEKISNQEKRVDKIEKFILDDKGR